MEAGMKRPHVTTVPIRDIAERVGGVIVGDDAVVVAGVTNSSTDVSRGDLFAALPGHRVHGADFAEDAEVRGAVAILTDRAGRELISTSTLPMIIVDEPRVVLGMVADLVYGEPSASLTLAGVTGTNGKTTVTAMLSAALIDAGLETGTMGTLGVQYAGRSVAGARTTPEAPDVHAALAVMVEAGMRCAVMEVSSIAVAEHRVDGLVFDVMAFTNLTQDHLDYHGDMEAYFAAKAAMFTPQRARCAVVCIDDVWGRRLADMVDSSAPSGIRLITVSALGNDADWRISHHGMSAHITGPDDVAIEMRLPMPGAVNAANTVVSLAMAAALGIPAGPAAQAIGQVRVPGRCETIEAPHAPMVIVDYAHTPDAVSRMVELAREAVSGRVIVVIGAGGDRDQAKRPLMGAAAGMGDHVVVTDDNPRHEDPREIRAAVLSGVPDGIGVDEIGDRSDAIAHAIAFADVDDVVLVLGKGHETGQQLGDVTLPFDDRAAVRAVLFGAAS